MCLQASAQQTVTMVGDLETYGEYAVTGMVGSFEMTLQVDTCSAGVLVFSAACSPNCPRTEYVPPPAIDCTEDCQFCIRNNTECSFSGTSNTFNAFSGIVVTDNFRIPVIQELSDMTRLGAITSGLAWYTSTRFQGKLGLAIPPPSSPIQSPLTKWFETNATSRTFAICMENFGGTFSIGVDGNTIPNMVWTNYTAYPNGGGYGVIISELRADSQKLAISIPDINGNRGSTLINSASKVIALPRKAFVAFANVIYSQCGQKGVKIPGVCDLDDAPHQNLFSGYCFALADKDISLFPSFRIQFQGTSQWIVINATSYLVPQVGYDETLYCLGILDAGARGEASLGQVFLKSVYALFDTENQRVGFTLQTPAVCGDSR